MFETIFFNFFFNYSYFLGRFNLVCDVTKLRFFLNKINFSYISRQAKAGPPWYFDRAVEHNKKNSHSTTSVTHR